MALLTVVDACSKLSDLIDETVFSHKPIFIAGEKSNAVLVSEEDWESIQETVYLLSIPGMRESIRGGLRISIKECSEELDW